MGVKQETSTHVVDRALFLMPRDKELQVPAMAHMQWFVNHFGEKMSKNDAAGMKCAKCSVRRVDREKCLNCGTIQAVPINVYALEYEVRIAPDDFERFKRCGMNLITQPVILSGPADMVIDLSDERLLSYYETGKHCGIACAIMLGDLSPHLPTFKRLQPKVSEYVWTACGALDPDLEALGLPYMTDEQLLGLQNDVITGAIGLASWQTYFVAALGLPVIEIVPRHRPREWLSKWANGGYRVVDGPRERWAAQATRAMRSVEVDIRKHTKAVVNAPLTVPNPLEE